VSDKQNIIENTRFSSNFQLPLVDRLKLAIKGVEGKSGLAFQNVSKTKNKMAITKTPTFRVLLQKEQLVFSSAHFITFAGDICECLHGHNYGLRAEVEGNLDENRYVIDFIAFRDALSELVKQLDHHMLLPTMHPMIQVDEQIDEVTVRFRKKRWVFPREDCMLLPIANTTAEEIAWWIATQLKKKLYSQIGPRLSMLEVGVDENHGQWGSCRLPWVE
jgi:6-pyruvoyltetrahydropterin/6-carboxytetrahydropterin synthase